jgi:hypothetical protein
MTDTRRTFGQIVHLHITRADSEPALQRANQLGQSSLLGGGRQASVKIAHQANADTSAVHLRCALGRGCDRKLMVPVLRHLDFAIDTPIAVTDHKMIACAALLRQTYRIPAGGSAVMHIDISPATRHHRGLGLKNHIQRFRRIQREQTPPHGSGQRRRSQHQQQKACKSHHAHQRNENGNCSILVFFHVRVPGRNRPSLARV